MKERDMEDLIAKYPSDFFPRNELILKGRQESFAGVGRFDLLFEDEFKSMILMELKAGTARYEDATQVARYRDELKRQGYKNVIMWVVATQIPPSVREFLEDKGIEYTEIHLPEFRRVADRHDHSIKSEAEPDAMDVIASARKELDQPNSAGHREGTPAGRSSEVEIGPTATSRSSFHWKATGFDLSLVNPQDFHRERFLELIEAFEQAVPSKRNASLVANLRQWASDPLCARISNGSVQSLLRWAVTSGWKAVPHAEAIWAYLFGRPAPNWRKWDQGRRKYEFDAAAWKVWFTSLNEVTDPPARKSIAAPPM